jgi:phage terminase large subunit
VTTAAEELAGPFSAEELEQLATQSRTGKLGRYYVALRIRQSGELRLLYSAQPRQDELHACPSPNILYGGQAGGGKSHALRWHGIMNCLMRSGLRVLLLRREFKDLETTHLLEIPKELPIEGEDAIAAYNDGKHRLTFTHPGEKPSVMVFGHCRTMKALAGYLSSQWDIILVDEGSHFDPQMLRMLRTRLRTSLAGVRPQFIVGTNPGGEAHLWLKARFITKNPTDSRKYRPELWAFISSALEDNAYLDADQYEEQFSEVSDAEYRAYRQGDWDAFAGQYFTEWQRSRHTVAGDTFELEDWHEVAAGMDWGYSPSPGTVEIARFDQFGRGTVYKELVFRESSATEAAQQLWARLDQPAEYRMTIWGDSAMWTPQAAKGGVSIAEEFNAELTRLKDEAGLEHAPVLVQANKDRMNGWHRCHQFLKIRPDPVAPGEESPWLMLVNDHPETGLGCPYLIETLPAQVHDDKQNGDLKKGATDHGCDALRYLLIAREPIAQLPDHKKPAKPHHKRVHDRTRRLVLQAMKRANDEQLEAQDAIGGELPPGVVDPNDEALLDAVGSDTSLDMEAVWT